LAGPKRRPISTWLAICRRRAKDVVTRVGGRELARFEHPANGAPDCKRGADQLCKEKGYAEGRSVDIESTQKCSAKSYFSGQGACRTENFVTRAVCQ